jgi:acetolactate synthase-1/2/3 large subunit
VHHVGGELDAALARLAALPPATNRWAAQALPIIARTFQQRCGRDTNSFSAHRAIDAVRRALPRDGVLSFDVGAHTHQICQPVDSACAEDLPDHQRVVVDGLRLPGRDRAKLARPDLPVVCLIGDGCFQMTLRRGRNRRSASALRLPIVVLDDKWLGLTR